MRIYDGAVTDDKPMGFEEPERVVRFQSLPDCFWYEGYIGNHALLVFGSSYTPEAAVQR